jgi:host factor-I protein
MMNKCVSAPAKGAAIMQKTQNLQDAFLNYIRREKIPVTLFLMNGFQLRGVVRSFDSFVVLIDADGRQQMIYKHAISTVAPARPVSLELQG